MTGYSRMSKPIYMTRRTALAASLSAGAVPLVACQPPRREGQPAGESRPVKLVWQIRGGPGESYERLATEAMQQFRQQRPHVTVEFVYDAGNLDKTLPMLIAGTGPDVLHGWGYILWQYAAKELIINHNDLVKDLKRTDLDDFMKWQWDAFVIPTTSFRVGMPTYVNMVVLMWNREHFQQAGQQPPTENWDHNDYAHMAKRLTRMEGDKQVYGGWIPVHIYDRFQYHVVMFGDQVVDPKDLTKTLLPEEPVQQALEWMRARLWDDKNLHADSPGPAAIAWEAAARSFLRWTSSHHGRDYGRLP
jgi:ABC-type glycerol-3-phosphate transport system substrate-binding protein